MARFIQKSFQNNILLSNLKDVACLSSTVRHHSTSKDPVYDVVIVGGGIVGLATARELSLRHRNIKMCLVEKEDKLSMHQSGHNSGVIHAGLYYKPDSLMAKLCVEGLKLTYEFCDENKVPYKKCGKLVVATDTEEVGRLEDLYKRSKENQVPGVELIEKDKIKEIEPHCVGLKAIWSPNTGIVDYGLVARTFGKIFQNNGGDIQLCFEVDSFNVSNEASSDLKQYFKPLVITSKSGRSVKTRYAVTCAGLQSDRIAKLTGCTSDPKIVPFRGEYLLLNPEKAKLIRGNIYPVPDPRFPFLGVHFTPRMNGEVWVGPNAVLALQREGYSWGDINFRDLAEVLTYPGFIRLAGRYVTKGLVETARSACISLIVKDLQKFVPSVTAADLSRGPSGVRAQAMNAKGELVSDFVFDTGVGELADRVLHCRNAPSPAATSSQSIAKYIANHIEKKFQL